MASLFDSPLAARRYIRGSAREGARPGLSPARRLGWGWAGPGELPTGACRAVTQSKRGSDVTTMRSGIETGAGQFNLMG
jgi:hypothetical protein